MIELKSEGGGVAQDVGGERGGVVGDISVKIKLTTFFLPLTLTFQVQFFC